MQKQNWFIGTYRIHNRKACGSAQRCTHLLLCMTEETRCHSRTTSKAGVHGHDSAWRTPLAIESDDDGGGGGGWAEVVVGRGDQQRIRPAHRTASALRSSDHARAAGLLAVALRRCNPTPTASRASHASDDPSLCTRAQRSRKTKTKSFLAAIDEA